MANLKLFATLGLFLCITIGVALLLERFGAFKKQNLDFDDSSNETSRIIATSFPEVTVLKPVINEQFSKCLREHLKLNYYSVFLDKFIQIHCDPPEQCLYDFLVDLGGIMYSLDIKVQLIEPSILFCLSPSARKYNLLTRGFSSSDYKGSRNVITFGVLHSEAKLLDQVEIRKKLIFSGYRILKFRRIMTGTTNESAVEDYDASHYFIRKYNIGMHLVVLYPKDTFMLSSAFNTTERNISGLQFGEDRAFENFTSAVTYLDNLSSSILLPSDLRYFLLDVMTSKFIECKPVLTPSVTPVKAEIGKALKEIKAVLASQMVMFWLWSQSLQGWYEKCDIQHYSEALEFSIAAKSVEGYNFSALFVNSSCQHIENYSNLMTNVREIKLNCFGIPIHLIFTYEDKVTYWYEYIGDGHSYKLRFPKFTLCSTNVYGQKLAVPCETGEILESEYGQFLKNRTLHLDPERMKNVLLVSSV